MWINRTLGDLISLQRGYDLTDVQRNPGSIPVMGSNGRNGWHDTARAPGPGVTVGRSGASAGVVTFVPGPYWPHNTALFVTDFKGNSPRFIAYLLSTLDLANFNSGSAQPSLNRNFVYPIVTAVPPLVEQNLIAGILSTYDDLIENNARRIAILEETARRIFEEWFFYFRAPGCEGLPMVESAIGPVPLGWEVKRLRELADETRDPADPRSIDPETVYVGLEHIPRRSTTFVDWGKAGQVGSLKLKFQTGDILFGKIRPYFHKCAVAPVAGVASSDAIIIRAKSHNVRALVLSLTSSDTFVAHAVKTSNGTKMPRADWKVLREYPLAIPPADLRQRFELTVWPMIELAAKLAAQNRNLRAQRDMLLPKLISGEIEINTASASFKEAAE
jgi:type I restriction enzyme S subunit